jgi:hypothetical protein
MDFGVGALGGGRPGKDLARERDEVYRNLGHDFYMDRSEKG